MREVVQYAAQQPGHHVASEKIFSFEGHRYGRFHAARAFVGRYCVSIGQYLMDLLGGVA